MEIGNQSIRFKTFRNSMQESNIFFICGTLQDDILRESTATTRIIRIIDHLEKFFEHLLNQKFLFWSFTIRRKDKISTNIKSTFSQEPDDRR